MPGPIVSFASVLIRLWLASAAVVAGLLAVVVLAAWRVGGDA